MQFGRLVVLCALAAGVPVRPGLPAQKTDPVDLARAADALAQEVARVRGIDFRTPVRKSVSGRAEIAGRKQGRIREEYGIGSLATEGRMLRALGLVGGPAEYGDSISGLLAEPVEALYDPGDATLHIASWLPAAAQKSVLAHELVRALQDQHFNTRSILEADLAGGNGDRTLAHRALFEGDRTAVMLQLELGPGGRHFSDLPDLAFVMESSMATVQGRNEASAGAPGYLRQQMLFPYGYGASFLQQVWKNRPGWETVNALYLDPPASTEQILHPEKYFGDRDDPKAVPPIDPAARLGQSWRIAHRGVLGEFSLGLFLGLHLTEEYSRKAVSGWGGDEVVYLEDDSGRDAVVVATVWDTEEDADTFRAAVEAWFRKRFPKGTLEQDASGGFSVADAGKLYAVSREGQSLVCVLGLPAADGRRWQGR